MLHKHWPRLLRKMQSAKDVPFQSPIILEKKGAAFRPPGVVGQQLYFLRAQETQNNASAFDACINSGKH